MAEYTISKIIIPNGDICNLKDTTAHPTTGSLTLSTSWSGNGPYTQTIIITGSTSNSKIDLQPNSTALAQLITDGVKAIWVENNNGILTAYALGAVPTASLTVQYTKTEVIV